MAFVDINSIQEAQTRIAPYVHRTPLVSKSNLASVSGFETLLFKAEIFQRAATFKWRGALNCIFKLAEEQTSPSKPTLHIVTHTSGNFGEAISRAVNTAQRTLGTKITAHIVMPRRSSNEKKACAMRRNGAEIVEVTSAAERETTSKKLLASIRDSVFIDQFQNRDIISGHATLGLEMAEQLAQNPVDCIIVPMGGSSLLAGVATALRAVMPKDKMPLIIGAEPASQGVAAESFQAGKLTDAAKAATASQRTSAALTDGLLTHLNEPVFELIRNGVDHIVSVPDAQIKQATVLIMERLKLVVEPSAAVAAAVALFHRAALQLKFTNRSLKRCCVVLSEGNLDLGTFLTSRL